MADGLLSLSWNNHSSTFCHMLSLLRDKERYTDVTITCDGKFYPVHKFVLSACSDYFLKMFERTPCKHPIIVLKDIQSKEIEALLSYMYDGVVSVAQTELSQLIKAAELLQIKGLAVPDEPPTTSKKTQGTKNCTEDTSPPPKRQRRDQSSHSQKEVQSNSGMQISSNSKDAEQRLQSRSEKDSHKTQENNNFQGSQRHSQIKNTFSELEMGSQDNQGIEFHQMPKKSPPSVDEILVDETLIKEEIMDASNEGSLSDTGLNYSLDMGPESGAPMEDPANLNLSATFDPSDGHSYDSQAGPSGLQGWPVMSEPGEVLTQDYGQETSQDVQLPNQSAPIPQQPHHMVEMQSDGHWANRSRRGMGLPVTEGARNRKTHHCPFCGYASPFMNNIRKHVRTHTGEKPYMCRHCSFRSSQKGSLKRHLMNIHEEGLDDAEAINMGSQKQMRSCQEDGLHTQ